MHKTNIMKIHTISIELYPRKIWIVECDSYGELNQRFIHNNGDSIDYNPDHVDAECFGEVKDKKTLLYGILMVYSDPRDVVSKIICHESCHLSSLLLKELGDEESNGLHEHYCYLSEYIFDKISKIINKGLKEV